MLQIASLFLLLVVTGSVFTMGWYIVTRGTLDVLPDGSLKKYGKILKEWSLYWEDVIDYKKMYYYGAQLENKLEDLKSMAPQYKLRMSVNEGGNSILCPSPLSDAEVQYVRGAIMCELLIKENDIFLYSEYPVYRFSELIRMPLSSCTPCMASVYGSLFWWVMWFVSVIFFKFDMSFVGWFVLWPFYVVSVSCLNYFIDKKL